jgi:PPK2 family polyphosphate:nucleotide phosphotransferase
MLKLETISTLPPKGVTKKVLDKKMFTLHKKLFGLQYLLFAESKHPILIILQGMDTSGKDGTIRHVFSCVNPMGCNVKSFKAPTELELKHDFLWRIYPNLPEKGMIQVFNRSHYEDILVPSVRKTLPAEVIEERYDFINCFEKQLASSGTIILKFFLHVSQKEQARRIEARKKDPQKKWKYDKSDDRAAKNWDVYQTVYEKVIQKCSPEIPWIVIPSDKKWYRNYFVAQTIIHQLQKLKMRFPQK